MDVNVFPGFVWPTVRTRQWNIGFCTVRGSMISRANVAYDGRLWTLGDCVDLF